jgi:hypothetical protein
LVVGLGEEAGLPPTVRDLENQIFAPQTPCHAQGARFNRRKVLSEQKNSSGRRIQRGVGNQQGVVFCLPLVVKILRSFTVNQTPISFGQQLETADHRRMTQFTKSQGFWWMDADLSVGTFVQRKWAAWSNPLRRAYRYYFLVSEIVSDLFKIKLILAEQTDRDMSG